MNHWKLMLGLLLTTVMLPMPIVRAESTPTNATTAPVATTAAVPSLTPYDLVYAAYQGRLRAQGLRSYGAFADGCNQGTLTANDVAQAAIKANLLPQSILQDQGYMNAVDAQMKSFKNNSGR
ncbi:hypothetical protein H6F89_14315 [Cyanobacteria bacterium FACHB-63]|nr:hypothetical protein [Cyanobacteria bacterium FACHB-63]